MALKKFVKANKEILQNSPKVLGVNFVAAVWIVMAIILCGLTILAYSMNSLGTIVLLVFFSAFAIAIISIYGETDAEEDS